MTLPWFRFYHEFAGDPVVQCLAFEDQRHFVMVLCLKGSGFLDREWPSDDFRNRMVCHALGLDPVAGAEAKRRLMEVGLVGVDWHPPAWERRQFKSDNSTERVRKFRAKTPEEELNPHRTDTEGNVTSNVSETLPTKKRVATRIPEDWTISDDLRGYAEKNLPGVDADALAEAFVDHWRAAPAEKGRKADWNATWRTWVRNAIRFGYPMAKRPSVATAKQIKFDANGRQIGA